MKRLCSLAVAAALILGGASVYAGEGCCAAGKTSAKSDACGDSHSKLNLTDAQKAKITTLKEQTTRATSTSESRAMMTKGMQEILTPEQFTQWQSSCEKAMKTGSAGECPMMKSMKKSADKTS